MFHAAYDFLPSFLATKTESAALVHLGSWVVSLSEGSRGLSCWPTPQAMYGSGLTNFPATDPMAVSLWPVLEIKE